MVNRANLASSLALEGKKFRGVRMRYSLVGAGLWPPVLKWTPKSSLYIGQHNSFHFEFHCGLDKKLGQTLEVN